MHTSRPAAPTDAQQRSHADATQSENEKIAELLARTGVTLRAQRVELYAVNDDDTAMLAAWWTAHISGSPIEPPIEAIPLEWFPWSLGNIKPAKYFFVRNARLLPLHTESNRTIGDLEMGSALYLPLPRAPRLIGAVAAYWSEERHTWPIEQLHRIREWGDEAITRFRDHPENDR